MHVPARAALFSAVLSAAAAASGAYEEAPRSPSQEAQAAEQPPAEADVGRALVVLGAVAEDLTRDEARARGTLVQSGALVTSVDRRGPARRSGIQSGDVIIALNGNPVSTAQDLDDALALLPAGSSAELTLVRDQITMPRRVALPQSKVEGRE